MKKEEFRIGNWVLVPTNNEIKIPCFPKQIKAITLFGELDFTEPTYKESHIVPIINCGEISLTEEWLLKFGFEKNFRIDSDGSKKTPVWRKGSFSITIWSDGRLFYDWIGGNIELKCIHQLQNLYFALTGEELTIKS